MATSRAAAHVAGIRTGLLPRPSAWWARATFAVAMIVHELLRYSVGAVVALAGVAFALGAFRAAAMHHAREPLFGFGAPDVWMPSAFAAGLFFVAARLRSSNRSPAR